MVGLNTDEQRVLYVCLLPDNVNRMLEYDSYGNLNHTTSLSRIVLTNDGTSIAVMADTGQFFGKYYWYAGVV